MFWKVFFNSLRKTEPPEEYRIYTDSFDRTVTVSNLNSYLGDKDRKSWQVRQASYESEISHWVAAASDAASGVRDVMHENHPAPRDDLVVSVLVDHSGSLRWDKAALASAIMEFSSRFLCAAGIRHEILGFTTSSWKGGNSRLRWLDDGCKYPGRLCDLLHLVYRSADEDEPLSPEAARTILQSDLLKENVDGEALEWAAGRLLQRPERKKLVLVVSDGAPVDDSTLWANGNGILHEHLLSVIGDLRERPEFQLAGIGLGYDVSGYYADSLRLESGEDMIRNLPEFLTDLTKS